jgi:hypothetical protein
VGAAKVSVTTKPGDNGRWENVTEGPQPCVMTFDTLGEARAAGRARAKRLRCLHLIYDVDGSPIGATTFGGPETGGD